MHQNRKNCRSDYSVIGLLFGIRNTYLQHNIEKILKLHVIFCSSVRCYRRYNEILDSVNQNQAVHNDQYIQN